MNNPQKTDEQKLIEFIADNAIETNRLKRENSELKALVYRMRQALNFVVERGCLCRIGTLRAHCRCGHEMVRRLIDEVDGGNK